MLLSGGDYRRVLDPGMACDADWHRLMHCGKAEDLMIGGLLIRRCPRAGDATPPLVAPR